MIKKLFPLFVSASIVALSSTSALAGELSLIGSELKYRAESQFTPTGQIFVTSFPASAIVSESEVEFPDVESLFDPSSGVPPGLIGSFVNMAIDVGADYIEFDYANAGFGRSASGFKNNDVFTFTAPIALQITDAVIDERTNIGLTPERVTFVGNELSVNFESLRYNPESFARINLTTEEATNPDPASVPEPSTT
ncbi:MAG: hypothetical protein WA896_05860, partial [Spirulinaceae cyanobacterium]